MRRLSIVVAAAVTSAMIVVAVTALAAVGADGRTAKPRASVAAKLAQARADGVAARDVRKPADDSADVQKLTACLRAHGAQPASAPADLKRWIVQHQSDATVVRALKECGAGPPPSCGDKGGQGAAPVAGGAKDGAG